MLRRILRFVVEQAMRGEDVPDATAIAIDALGKSPGFRSSRGPSVRVGPNRLRTVLELYYSKEGAADDAVIQLQAGSCRPTFELRKPSTTPDPVKDALSLAGAYQEIMTAAANSFVLRALKSALKSQPENPCLLAAYTDICLDAHKFQFKTLERPLDQAIRALERALTVEPDNPAVVFQHAMMAMEHQDLATVTERANHLIRQDSDDTAAVCRGVFLLAQDAPSTSVQQTFRPV
jgi:predicted Zn-dependent protease